VVQGCNAAQGAAARSAPLHCSAALARYCGAALAASWRQSWAPAPPQPRSSSGGRSIPAAWGLLCFPAQLLCPTCSVAAAHPLGRPPRQGDAGHRRRARVALSGWSARLTPEAWPGAKPRDILLWPGAEARDMLCLHGTPKRPARPCAVAGESRRRLGPRRIPTDHTAPMRRDCVVACICFCLCVARQRGCSNGSALPQHIAPARRAR
jgi:hypothetical protein